MARNPHLDEAAAIFTELGWADAAYADAPTLPLGTAEQRKAALAGLRSGEWTDGQTGPKYVDVDLGMLWLFSVRIGVEARRATATMEAMGVVAGWKVPGDVAFAVLVERGLAFARGFVEHRRFWTWGFSLRLVAHFQLPVPVDHEYLDWWARNAGWVTTDGQGILGGAFYGTYSDDSVDDEAMVEDRFAEHVNRPRFYAASLRGSVPGSGERWWLA